MHLEKVFPTTKHPDRNCSLWPTTGVRQSVWSWTQLLCYSQKKRMKTSCIYDEKFCFFLFDCKISVWSVWAELWEISCEKLKIWNIRSEALRFAWDEVKNQQNRKALMSGAGGRQARAFCCRHWGTARTFLSNKFYNPLMGSSRFVPVRPNAVYTKTKSKQGKQRH